MGIRVGVALAWLPCPCPLESLTASRTRPEWKEGEINQELRNSGSLLSQICCFWCSFVSFWLLATSAPYLPFFLSLLPPVKIPSRTRSEAAKFLEGICRESLLSSPPNPQREKPQNVSWEGPNPPEPTPKIPSSHAPAADPRSFSLLEKRDPSQKRSGCKSASLIP